MHNEEAFGKYEIKALPSSLNTNGKTWYDAEITYAAVARDATGNPVIGKGDDNKHRVDVTFVIPDVLNDVSGKPEELKRRFVISYGQSKETGRPWSAFAQFLAAATGIPGGDPRQRQIAPKHLINKRVSLCPVLTDTGYVNVKEITKCDGAPHAAVKAAPVATPPPANDYTFSDDEIPF